ncbi:MAG TPA: RluA family pseudouridine synthase [Clostridiales bacterium]|nr:RluA family pseudouridine synthase [Clostridiales bacterium]
MRTINYTIPSEFDNQKVLHYLRSVGLSCSLIRSLKTVPNGIMLNGEHTRTVDIVRTGDILTINIPNDKNEIEPTEIALNIIYEDNDILIINKPAGIAMHPTHNHQGDTLANAVAYYHQKQDKNHTFRSIGRLDKSTSGLVLIALNPLAAASLNGKVEKTYYALVGGFLEGNGTIDRPIYRPYPNKTLRAVGETGEHAVTHWQALKTDGKRTLVRVNLETGRTHQIRVHFASLNMSLVGDDMYASADNSVSRAALHCGEMSFIHPITKKAMHFSVALPEDMQKIL